MKNLMLATFFVLVAGGCTTVDHHEHVHGKDIYATDPGTVKPVYIGQRISHVVVFDYDSASLPYDAAEVVEPHVRHLLKSSGIQISLQGNASSEGDRAYNYDLGLQRAMAVEQLFVELGVDKNRVHVTSVGENRSDLVPNRSVVIAY